MAAGGVGAIRTLTLLATGASTAALWAERCLVRHPQVRYTRRLISARGRGEMVDTPDLGSGGASRGGSSPFARTTVRVVWTHRVIKD
jgi:hypothetical protein